MLMAAPLIIAFWFAPFLVGWDRVSPLKSLFFSMVASWRNWRALGMFTLGALLVAGIMPGLILVVISQIAGLALSVALIALRMVLDFPRRARADRQHLRQLPGHFSSHRG